MADSTDNGSLDLSAIDEILGTTRSKLNSSEYVRDFLNSGEMGREVDLTTGAFVGKNAKQVKMALDAARKKVSDETGMLAIPGGTDIQVRIKQETNGKKGAEKVVTSERLFIINTRLVAEARAATK